ncbi:MAG: hypothetical protein II330_06715, partial [Clostridia bacterium]|nr:hypothetical protein [Clostridia bacterium]
VADADAIDTAALLDRLKIADSIVPQFPGYAWANTKFGPFVQDPEFKNYSVVQESGAYGSMGWGYGSNYYDPNAPATYKAPYPISECTDTLQYRDSVTHSLDAQAVHNYVFESERAYYDVIVDAETGECIGWQLEGELLGVPYVTEQEKIDAVYAYLAGCVSDPEAYTLGEREVLEGYTVYRYSRYVGEFDSCDALIAYFDSQGNMVAILGSYLGAMREMEEIPQDLLDTVRAKLTEIANTYADAFEISISIKKLYISPVGQIALNCSVTVREQELGERLEYRYHVYLTEWVISAD